MRARSGFDRLARSRPSPSTATEITRTDGRRRSRRELKSRASKAPAAILATDGERAPPLRTKPDLVLPGRQLESRVFTPPVAPSTEIPRSRAGWHARLARAGEDDTRSAAACRADARVGGWYPKATESQPAASRTRRPDDPNEGASRGRCAPPPRGRGPLPGESRERRTAGGSGSGPGREAFSSAARGPAAAHDDAGSARGRRHSQGAGGVTSAGGGRLRRSRRAARRPEQRHRGRQ